MLYDVYMFGVQEGALISDDFMTPKVTPIRHEISSSLEFKNWLSRMIMEELTTVAFEGINVSGKSLCY